MRLGLAGGGVHSTLPHRYQRNDVVYTGTHDNDTTRGWWENAASAEEKAEVKAYLHPEDRDVVWALMRAAAASVADICLFPAQDVLDLGSEARMNVPSLPKGNWSWRCPEGVWKTRLAHRLAKLTEVTDRDRVEQAE